MVCSTTTNVAFYEMMILSDQATPTYTYPASRMGIVPFEGVPLELAHLVLEFGRIEHRGFVHDFESVHAPCQTSQPYCGMPSFDLVPSAGVHGKRLLQQGRPDLMMSLFKSLLKHESK